ncbi:MAG: hypothetical protein D8M59_17040 [Planctomycetes bacterium]|nr:hypothetical protein [Planctomycetota bacterium]NOG55530.1 hypothetical protein [Planctomycetota bacterium]
MSVSAAATVAFLLTGCLIASAAVVSGSLTFTDQTAGDDPEDPWPAALCLVPEMSFIPALDTWPAVADAALPGHEQYQEVIEQDWNHRIRPWLQQRLTPSTVVALSRWAREEMLDLFVELPSFDDPAFVPITHHVKSHMIMYRLQLSPSLPSHSPLVTRSLMLFCLFDTERQEIVGVTVTIRGEAQE